MQSIIIAHAVATTLVRLAAKAIANLSVTLVRTVKFKSGRIQTISFVRTKDGTVTAKTRGLPPITVYARPTIHDRLQRFAAQVGSFRFYGVSEKDVYRKAALHAWSM